MTRHATPVLAAVMCVGVAACLCGCSAFAPTVTRIPHPTAHPAHASAAAQSSATTTSWVGEDEVGASVEFPYYLHLTDTDGVVTGTVRIAQPAGSTGAITVNDGTVTGTQHGDTINLTSNSGFYIDPPLYANGTITPDMMELGGTLMGVQALQNDVPFDTGQMTFLPGTTTAFTAMVNKFGQTLDSHK